MAIIKSLTLLMWVGLGGVGWLFLEKPTSSDKQHYYSQERQIALYIFGDSLFDVGNNNHLQNAAFYSNFFPYGIDFFNQSSGRFSSGRNMADFIASYLNLPLIPPYLLPGYQRFMNGVNFASGGAGALVETFQNSVIDLKTQLRYFKDVERKLIESIGNKETKSFFAKTLFIFNIGGNDYVAPLTTNSTMLQNFTKGEYVDMVIGNITTVLKEIHKIGGRKFGFLNVLPLGCTPLLKATFNITEGGCVEEVDVLVKLHNKRLTKTLEELHTQLKGFEYSLFDLHTTLGERMQNPSKYGFKEGDNLACCGGGPYRGLRTCGSKDQKYELCEDPNNYVHFDPFHPTDETNKQLAELMWSGSSNIVTPYNIKTLLGLLGVKDGVCFVSWALSSNNNLLRKYM